MSEDKSKILVLSESRKNKVAKLLATSHAKPMDLETVLPWKDGIDKSIFPKELHHSWIYGTPYYEQLTDEQKLELSWVETGRDISMFIWLEQTLPVLYMGYINRYYDQLDEGTIEYLMVFSKEELVHTLTFKRFMAMAELELWKPPVDLFELLTVTLPKMKPEVGVLFTLLVEWVAESSAMHTSQGPDINPMSRQLFKAHHFDEARHIAFGRWISECYFENAPLEEAQEIRNMAKKIIPKLINLFTYNPEIADRTSFEFPIGKHEQDKIETVFASQSNASINEERFSEFFSWIDKLGLR
jgi:hypothetical protein